MLKLLRKNTKTIVWIVVASFVLWGGYSVSTQFDKNTRYAGEVFGKPVSFQEFELFYRSVQLFSFGQNAPQNVPEILRQQAWQSIVMSHEAKRQKIVVTDQEVRNEIFRLMALQNIENPTPEIYTKWLQTGVRETPQAFESQIRELLRIQKLVQKINTDPVSTPSDEDIQKLFLKDGQKINLKVLKFASLEEAKNFSLKAKDAKSWGKEATAAKLESTETGLVNLDTLIRDFGVSESQGAALWDLPKGHVSAPIAAKDQFILFLVQEKQTVAEKDFDAAAKEKYSKFFTDRQRYERFALWNQKTFAEAALKDYQQTRQS